jgi:hypothetical protein
MGKVRLRQRSRYQRTSLPKHASRAFQNILQVSNLVSPKGSYHESMDYMRISYVPMAMLAELQRTTMGVDPALRFETYRSFADTYLYKLLPDGTPSREADNEYPILDDRDTAAFGCAVNRFKNPYAAWLLSAKVALRCKSGPHPFLIFYGTILT